MMATYGGCGYRLYGIPSPVHAHDRCVCGHIQRLIESMCVFFVNDLAPHPTLMLVMYFGWATAQCMRKNDGFCLCAMDVRRISIHFNASI